MRSKLTKSCVSRGGHAVCVDYIFFFCFPLGEMTALTSKFERENGATSNRELMCVCVCV